VTLIGWVETDEVVEFWPEADDLTTGALISYLQAAYEQCVEFLPHVAVPTPPIALPPPERYILAQVMQAQALFRSNVAGSGDTLGGDGQSVTLFPMDWTVKNLLRPTKIGRVL
jgi:hypothetical protein